MTGICGAAMAGGANGVMPAADSGVVLLFGRAAAAVGGSEAVGKAGVGELTAAAAELLVLTGWGAVAGMSYFCSCNRNQLDLMEL